MRHGTNVELSWTIWHWCTNHGVRLVYASSAATYGDGTAGFDDDCIPAALQRLRPLNLYGWTKHAFDLRVARVMAEHRPHPPQWVGLKFFNVYGPNEYHKGRMISVIKVKYDEVADGGPARLFRSTEPGLADGEQKRDFIWVGDVVDMLWLMDTPGVSGLFNLGTGQARSYLDLAHAVCDAAGVPRNIEFIDMPEAAARPIPVLHPGRDGQPSHRRVCGKFTPLEEGVRRYVQDYLTQPDLLRMISVLLFPQFDPASSRSAPSASVVCAGLYRRAGAWLAAGALSGAAVPRGRDTGPGGRFSHVGDARGVLGGRLGYVLFYQPPFYLTHPAMILDVWEAA